MENEELENMMNERADKEAELRALHSQLDASSSTYGDYNMCKAVEKLITMLSEREDVVTTIKEWADDISSKMSEKIIERNNIRSRIIELENELNS